MKERSAASLRNAEKRASWLASLTPERLAEFRAKAVERSKLWMLAHPEKKKRKRKYDPVKSKPRLAEWRAKNPGYVTPKRAAKRVETKRLRAEAKPINYQKRLARNKAWQEANAERYAAYKREWYLANRERQKRAALSRAPETNTKLRLRRQTDPQFAIVSRLRCRMRKALFAQGAVRAAASAALVGCSWLQFRAHIEAQFVDGMTWENRSAWHLDHKMPCASFDLTDPAQQLACFHYSNIRPVWSAVNMRKSAKILPEFLLASNEPARTEYF